MMAYGAFSELLELAINEYRLNHEERKRLKNESCVVEVPGFYTNWQCSL